LLKNIKKRGRDYEQNIEPEYLEKINNSYLTFIENNPSLNIKIIDVSGLDFVNNRADYIYVLNQILD
jgi:deoxyadenosine/deoxycytidine kinase